MAKEMWAVSQGEYSDYRVQFLCETKEDAETAVKNWNEKDGYGAPFIESFPIYSASDVEVLETYSIGCHLAVSDQIDPRHQTQVDQGSYEYVYKSWAFSGQNPEDDMDHTNSKVEWTWTNYNEKVGYLHVRGQDRERVRRVFSDRRAELLANPPMMQEKRLGTGIF